MWDSKPKKITSATLGLEAKIALTVNIYIIDKYPNLIFYFIQKSIHLCY